MTKRNYRPFRLEDLTGGMNTRDYASEIEDKQSVLLENWNFKGNKLVSSKGIELVYNNSNTEPIGGISTDLDDTYWLQDGGLYKNGDRIDALQVTDLTIVDQDLSEQYQTQFELGGVHYKRNATSDILSRFEDDINATAEYNAELIGDVLRIRANDFGAFSITNPYERMLSFTGGTDGVDFDLILDGVTYTATYSSTPSTTIINMRNAVLAGGLYEAEYTPYLGIDKLWLTKKTLTTFTVSCSITATNGNRTKNIVDLDDLSLGDAPDTLGNITVSSYGVLVTDRRGIATSFYIDGILTKISAQAIGVPTVGTIYNGKIILAGYEGKDNIIFSQTDDPVANGNEMLEFGSYSAGAQSVSGGNKGEITGFIVGENGLYVFKNNEVWYTNSEKDTGTSFNFIFNKITSNGALNQNVITEVEQETFFYDHISRAVRRLGYEQNLTTLRDVAISREIEDVLQALPEAQDLATASFCYPNYKLELSDGTGPDITFQPGFTYSANNVTLTYNVETKSWSTETDKHYTGLYPTATFKGTFGTSGGDIYKDDSGNTEETGDSLSKEYTHGDDIRYKKYGRFDIVGKIIPDSGLTKTLTIQIIIDDEVIETREIEASATFQIREKIDLYDIGQKFQFSIGHSGDGSVEIYDVVLYDKLTTIQPQDYS